MFAGLRPGASVGKFKLFRTQDPLPVFVVPEDVLPLVPAVDDVKHRNAIEGTQSELVRAHGLRRTRYRGLPKAKLQNYFIGAACNVKRWLRRAAWELASGLTAKLSAAPAS